MFASAISANTGVHTRQPPMSNALRSHLPVPPDKTLLASLPASAQNGSPAPRPEEQPRMKVLEEHGMHDIKNENWNAYGQFTYISSSKPSFPALYTNLNGRNEDDFASEVGLPRGR